MYNILQYIKIAITSKSAIRKNEMVVFFDSNVIIFSILLYNVLYLMCA